MSETRKDFPELSAKLDEIWPEAKEHPLMFLRLAARLTALVGDRSQLDRGLALARDLGSSFEPLVVDWCKVLLGELDEAPGEDLGLAIIATQDLACLMNLARDTLPVTAQQSIQALVEAAEETPLDLEATETLEVFLEQFPIPEQYRLGIVDSPLSDYEIVVLDRVRQMLPVLSKRRVTQPAGAELQTGALATQPKCVAEPVAECARRWIEQIKPPPFEELVAAVLRVPEFLLGATPSPALAGAGTRLGRKTTPGTTAQISISLPKAFGKHLLSQCHEDVPPELREEAALALGRQFLKERLPWAADDLHIKRKTLSVQEAAFVAYLKVVAPDSVHRQAFLRIVLVRPNTGDLQAVLRNDGKPAMFAPVSHSQAELGNIDVVTLKIEPGEQQ